MKYANPVPLRLTGFASTTQMLSMVNAGWSTGAGAPFVLATAVAYGGTAQFAAGLMDMPRGNTFGFVAICSYGAFWQTFGLFVEFFAAKVPGTFASWQLLMWGLFTFYVWIGTLALNRAVQSIFLTLWITLFLLAAGDFIGSAALHHAGGYMGLLTAELAFYLAAVDVINETHGKVILPVGAPAPAARAPKTV